MDYLAHYNSPLGPMTMASDGTALVGLWFDGQRHFGSTINDEYEECDIMPVFDDTHRWLDVYFLGKEPGFIPPLLLRGSQFQRRVWQQLLHIGFGQTLTYSEVGRLIANQYGTTKIFARAVGGAVGHNPISLIVPCHRVVGVGGKITGYAGGIERKAKLLELEKRIFSL